MTQSTYLPNVTHTKAQAFAFFQGALAAAASTNAGATAPPETWPGMLWVDTAARALKMRNEANSGWIVLGSYASGHFVPAGVTRLSEAQATDPTGTAFGALSGTLLKAAVAAFAPPAGWHPYDRTATGDSATGVFYDFATEGTSQYLEAPTFEPGYDYMIRLDGLLPLNPGVLRGQFWVPEPGFWTNGFDLTSAVQARVPLGGRIRIPDPLRPRPIG
ncbi:hypothetical protein JMJ94_21930, partial [Rhodovulum visakhapatnamense]|nr:hypothetical protein [Rhodovulum visakhapatnamense]